MEEYTRFMKDFLAMAGAIFILSSTVLAVTLIHNFLFLNSGVSQSGTVLGWRSY